MDLGAYLPETAPVEEAGHDAGIVSLYLGSRRVEPLQHGSRHPSFRRARIWPTLSNSPVPTAAHSTFPARPGCTHNRGDGRGRCEPGRDSDAAVGEGLLHPTLAGCIVRIPGHAHVVFLDALQQFSGLRAAPHVAPADVLNGEPVSLRAARRFPQELVDAGASSLRWWSRPAPA